MASPFDPRQGGADLRSLWPPLALDDSPLQPWEWARAVENLGRGTPGDTAQPSPSDIIPPRVWADAVDRAGQAPAIGPQGGIGPAPPPASSSAPGDGGPPAAPMRAMAAAYAPDQEDAPTRDGSQIGAGEMFPPSPGVGAIPASDAAVPAAARVRVSRAPPDDPDRPPTPAPHPAGQFLRPDLLAGPDPLVAAMAGGPPNKNPFGFVVDPRSGSVSRWRFVPTSDLSNRSRSVLEPVSPAEKQQFLEWMTGARANYPLGAISPEEQTARMQLQQGALPGAKGPPISATVAGNTVTYQLPDGSSYPLSSKGHPGRDQNPRNIKWIGGFAERHGAIGRDGDFAIFPSDEEAYRASVALMSSMAGNGREDAGHPAGTLSNVIWQWSPPSDHNDTEGMIKDIMEMTGFDRNARFGSLTAEQKRAFARASAHREGYMSFAPELPPSVR